MPSLTKVKSFTRDLDRYLENTKYSTINRSLPVIKKLAYVGKQLISLRIR